MEEKTFLNIELPDTQVTIVLREDKRYVVTLSRDGRMTCQDYYFDVDCAMQRACQHVNFLGPFLGELIYKPR